MTKNSTLAFIGSKIWNVEDSLPVRSGHFDLRPMWTLDNIEVYTLTCKANDSSIVLTVEDGVIIERSDWTPLYPEEWYEEEAE